MDSAKRKANEKRFDFVEELTGGGRRYWFEISGKFGWNARYVKEVDVDEITTKFYQEIYNEKNELIEIHQKYPEDTGHQKL